MFNAKGAEGAKGKPGFTDLEYKMELSADDTDGRR